MVEELESAGNDGHLGGSSEFAGALLATGNADKNGAGINVTKVYKATVRALVPSEDFRLCYNSLARKTFVQELSGALVVCGTGTWERHERDALMSPPRLFCHRSEEAGSWKRLVPCSGWARPGGHRAASTRAPWRAFGTSRAALAVVAALELRVLRARQANKSSLYRVRVAQGGQLGVLGVPPAQPWVLGRLLRQDARVSRQARENRG